MNGGIPIPPFFLLSELASATCFSDPTPCGSMHSAVLAKIKASGWNESCDYFIQWRNDDSSDD
jgi:hypothetical protein